MRTTEHPLLGDCGSNGSLIRRKCFLVADILSEIRHRMRVVRTCLRRLVCTAKSGVGRTPQCAGRGAGQRVRRGGGMGWW